MQEVPGGKGGIFLSTWSPTRESNDDLNFLKELVEAGKVRPIIDRTYPLEDVVEAHRYVDEGTQEEAMWL